MHTARSFVIMGSIFAGTICVGFAPQAQAALLIHSGDVLCHATAAGPQYYYSHIGLLGIGDERLLLGNTDEARRLERLTLDQLTGEFARYVAEHHEIDALTLLFPRCEVTKPGAAATRIEEATYFRDGASVFYETSEKIRVHWAPDLRQSVLASSQAVANAAAHRAALVVGNSAYSHVGALLNPTNDAVAVGASLERLGFEVTTVLDANRGRLAQTLRDFEMHTAEADIALVFYAGRALEVGGSHYVMPVDARMSHPEDAPVEGIYVDRLIHAIAGARMGIVILDACKNDPLPIVRNVALVREAHPVVSKLWTRPGGLLIAYAASSGCPDDGPPRRRRLLAETAHTHWRCWSNWRSPTSRSV